MKKNIYNNMYLLISTQFDILFNLILLNYKPKTKKQIMRPHSMINRKINEFVIF